jgi:tRNA pseudouridine55 synthase
MSGLLFGFLNVNKSGGMTAHDVVARIRRIARVKQVGHGGTLDPMATGVLPVAIGKACRLLRFLPGKKTYLAGIRFGRSTTTDDVEGEVLTESDAIPSQADVLALLPQFAGAQKQIPPMYSAIHVGGKRLYQLARAGETSETVDVPVREVFIDSIEAIAYEAPILKVRVVCSAGTYIRSIARDLGRKLGCGGCLDSLVREQAGPFNIGESHSLDELKEAAESNQLVSKLVPPQLVLPLIGFDLSDDQAKQLRLGQSFLLEQQFLLMNSGAAAIEDNETNGPQLGSPQEDHLLALYKGSLLAVCRRANEDGSDLVRIKPEVVLANGE